MTVTQALVKLRDDIISWCTMNFKKKADVTTVSSLSNSLSSHTSNSKAVMKIGGPVRLVVTSSGHVSGIEGDSYVNEFVSTIGTENTISVGYVVPKNSIKEIVSTSNRVYVRIPTISKMCETQSIILTKGVQYGEETPSDPEDGQLYFIKV